MKHSLIFSFTLLILGSCSQSAKTADTSNTTTTTGSTTSTGSEKDYFQRAIEQNKLTMVDFYTTWCGPCKKMAPFVEQILENRAKDVTVLSIDAEKETNISSQFALEGYPTLIFFKNGKVIHRELGYKNLEELNALVDQLK